MEKVYDLGTNNLVAQDIYEYNNLNWEDQLTKFNDNSITYDEIGNPLTIGNSIALDWMNGRQLNQYSDSNHTTKYEYNIDGIRTSKTIVPYAPSYEESKPCTTAKIVDGDVARGDRLTILQSIDHVEFGGDVMCDNKSSALSVAIAFKGYFYHNSHCNGATGYYPHLSSVGWTKTSTYLVLSHFIGKEEILVLVKKNIDGDAYKKLLDYAFSKCDTISIIKYCDQHSQENNEIIKIILSKSQYTINDIVSKYSEKLIEEMYNHFIDDSVIVDDEYKKKFEKRIDENFDKEHAERFKKRNRQLCIWHALGFTVYNALSDRWSKQYKNNIIIKKEKSISDIDYNLIPYTNTYYMKLDKHIKQEILNKNSIYDWRFPTSLEDLCFYKNDYCWLYSVAHEEICDIFCENEEEYEYLKSIGIEFVDDKFVPSPKEQLIYEEY